MGFEEVLGSAIEMSEFREVGNESGGEVRARLSKSGSYVRS